MTEQWMSEKVNGGHDICTSHLEFETDIKYVQMKDLRRSWGSHIENMCFSWTLSWIKPHNL